MAKNTKNPANKEHSLFRKLTRLFSGPIVSYNRQNIRQARRRASWPNHSRVRTAAGHEFKRGDYNPYESMQANYMANQNRRERYIDFDQMEYTPEIASAMDIYADEMTTSTDINEMLRIKCPNEEIKIALEGLYYNVLNIDFNLFGWCRSMCKYGDFFLYLDIDDEAGIKHAIGLPPQELERLEGEDKTNPNYIQYQWNNASVTLENWQVAHFRILGNDKYAPYGTSILEPARRIWRQLTLLEDAMMAYRIVRSPERRVFYIDVGAIAPTEIEQYMQKVMTQMKRHQIVDSDSGRVDLRYNPMSVEEDYYIPIRAGTNSRVESLPGGTYTGDIDDVKYLRDKLFSALKIPASYLSRGEGSDEDKTTLAQKDIRFARTIQRLQRSVISELEKVGIVHLFTLGYRGKDLVNFSLKLNNPSKLAELQELEHWRTKFDTAAAATEGHFSRRWVAENIFDLSEDDILRIKREMHHDKKFEASLEAAVEGAAGGGAADLGGDLGALPGAEEDLDADLGADLGGEDLGGDLGGDEIDTGPEEGDLLAAPEEPVPAKRDEDWYKLKKNNAYGRTEETTTKKSKDKWYKPVATDTRDMGARKRNYTSKYGGSIASSSRRNVFNGAYGPMKSLSKGIYEVLEPNYNVDEQKILDTNKDIESLIKQLESNKDET